MDIETRVRQRCELDDGHPGKHRHGIRAWPPNRYVDTRAAFTETR